VRKGRTDSGWSGLAGLLGYKSGMRGSILLSRFLASPCRVPRFDVVSDSLLPPFHVLVALRQTFSDLCDSLQPAFQGNPKQGIARLLDPACSRS
jgi:hypothetical protein